jgi:hypothetical protein
MRKSLLTSSCPSVSTELGYHRTDFHKIWYLSIFRKAVQKIQALLNSDENKVYFTYRPIKILIVSRSVLPRTRNASGKNCTGNLNIPFVSINVFFEYCVVYEIICKNTIVGADQRWQYSVTCIACWINKATHTHTHTHTRTHTHNMQHLLLWHGNCCKNTPQCYVTRMLYLLPILFTFETETCFMLVPYTSWIY